MCDSILFTVSFIEISICRKLDYRYRIVGSGVLGLGTLFIIYSDLFGAVNIHDLFRMVTVITAFSFGALSIAFFARVSCVIYTKAADEFAEYRKFVEISGKPAIRKVVDP